MGVWFQSFHHSLMFLNVHNLTARLISSFSTRANLM